MADALIGVFTATTADDRIGLPNHGLANGDQVRFVIGAVGNTLPTPLVDSTHYFVVNVRGNDFMTALTSGGSVIDLTTKGTGSNQVWKVDPLQTSAVMARVPVSITLVGDDRSTTFKFKLANLLAVNSAGHGLIVNTSAVPIAIDGAVGEDPSNAVSFHVLTDGTITATFATAPDGVFTLNMNFYFASM